ncbi:MAG: hypothetical protein KGH94_03705 [Candidatus Micrarchaeota archaeon]|nr:hypothetical protein [Candidatus Micrarchaeota archaeon]
MPERSGGSRRNVMHVDSSADWERHLAYRQKEGAWIVFNYIYWALYIFVVGALLVAAGTPQHLVLAFGWAAIVLAVFMVIYGFTKSLHHRLMRKHG